jgi:hypothetical protein
MFAGQNHADPHKDADHETNEETKAGCVTHGSIAQIENPRRLVLMHGQKSAPVIGARKSGPVK